MKNRKMAALALASVLTLSANVTALAETPETGEQTETAQETATQNRKHGVKITEPENAIGKDATKEKALSDAGISADQAGKVKVRLSEQEDGTVIYKVSFVFDSQRYSYMINALTGAVSDKNTEAVSENSSGSSHCKKGFEKTAESVADDAAA